MDSSSVETDPDHADPLLAAMPFTMECGIRVTRTEPESVEGRLDWAPERCTAGGILHGGVLMALADSLGGICAFLNLPAGANTSTIESKSNFFRAVRNGTISGRARPVHVGRSTIVVQSEVHDSSDRLVSLTLQTQAVLAPTTR